MYLSDQNMMPKITLALFLLAVCVINDTHALTSNPHLNEGNDGVDQGQLIINFQDDVCNTDIDLVTTVSYMKPSAFESTIFFNIDHSDTFCFTLYEMISKRNGNSEHRKWCEAYRSLGSIWHGTLSPGSYWINPFEIVEMASLSNGRFYILGFSTSYEIVVSKAILLQKEISIEE